MCNTIRKEVEAQVGPTNEGLTLLSSMPTEWQAYACATGDGIFHQTFLVMHNASKTKVYGSWAAQQVFSWDIRQAMTGKYPEFLPVAEHIDFMQGE